MAEEHEHDWMIDVFAKEFPIPSEILDDPKRRYKFVENIVNEILPKNAQLIRKSLQKRYFSHHLSNLYLKLPFERRLRKHWKIPLQLLDMLLDVCSEVGSNYNSKLISENNNTARLSALSRIHAKACQVSYEANNLLRSGYADGAFARWRTIHELSVIARYLDSNDEYIAQKYLDYSYIENYNEAKEYQLHCSELGFPPIEDSKMTLLKSLKNNIVEKYGSEFTRHFGWLCEQFPLNKCNFKALEEAVSLQFMRPFYIMSCHNIHSGPKGIFFRIGLDSESPRAEVSLAGPSNYGLADPGQCIAKSLASITETYVMNDETYEHLVSVFVLNSFVEDIAREFLIAQQRIEDKERELFSNRKNKRRYKFK